MSDEYTQRYQQLSHEELYQQLHAGKPDQIDDLGSKWRSMETTLDGLANSLRTDLDRLAPSWTGDASQEFQRRLDLIVSFSGGLATEFRGVHEGLSFMSGPLRTAQGESESPEETDDHDKAVTGAVIGGVIAGPAGAAIGGLWGHNKDEEEQERARQRMVEVVSRLAADYAVSRAGAWPTQPLIPPPGLPGEIDGTSATTNVSPRSETVRQGPETGTGDSSRRTADIGRVSTPSEHSTTGVGVLTGALGVAVGSREKAKDPDTQNDPGTGTSLSSAGTGALLAGWPAGAGGLVATAASSASSSGAGMQIGQPAGTPAGGVLNSGSLSASSGGGRTNPTGGTATGQAATAAGKGGMTAARVDGPGRADAAGRQAAVGSRPGVLGGRGNGPDEGDDEGRSTWLTEDEMVWQGREQAAPSVLGGSAE